MGPPTDRATPTSRAVRPVRPRISLRLRWQAWRATLSVPSLLAACDETRVISLIAALNGGLAIVVVSLFAWFTGLPLLFPALGPTAFILFAKPFAPDAAPRSVVLSHFTALSCGVLVRLLVEALSGSAISVATNGWPPVCSAGLALALTCLLLVRMSCPHPPACATALITALGGVKDWTGLLAMAAAVVVITLIALGVNRLAGLNVPAWSRAGQMER